MTYEEAIEVLKVAKAEVEWNYPMDYQIALDMAIEVLKKRIPMKPEEDEFTRLDDPPRRIYRCPSCYFNYWEEYECWPDYCGACGQALDWGDAK